MYYILVCTRPTMENVIKHPKKMKNAMYIVFGVFALALFAITRIHPGYANE
jgi:hypothetical protein